MHRLLSILEKVIFAAFQIPKVTCYLGDHVIGRLYLFCFLSFFFLLFLSLTLIDKFKFSSSDFILNKKC